MSKHDGDLKAAGAGRVELDELRAAIGQFPRVTANRHYAMARFLSGQDGWSDARSALGGTFAEAIVATGLIGGSDR